VQEQRALAQIGLGARIQAIAHGDGSSAQVDVTVIGRHGDLQYRVAQQLRQLRAQHINRRAGQRTRRSATLARASRLASRPIAVLDEQGLDRIRSDAFEKVLVGRAQVDDAAVDIVDELVSNEDIRVPGRHTPLGLTSPVS
jgi:hypothetical protein